MLRRILLMAGLIGLSLLALTGCLEGAEAQVKASLGQEFILPVGQTAEIKEENLLIKFEKVTADSRCPEGVQCIWAGEAKCQTYFSFSDSELTHASFELTDSGGNVEGYSQVTWTSNMKPTYKINFRLEPYPEAGKQISDSDYKLIMMITK